MTMKIAWVKNAKPSIANASPNTSRNVAMKFGQSSPSSNDMLFGFVAAGLFLIADPCCSRAGPPTATVDRRAWRPTPARRAREKGP